MDPMAAIETEIDGIEARARRLEGDPQEELEAPWEILVVDERSEVHQLAALVSERFKHLGRSFGFVHAYSVEEAKSVLRENGRIAVAIISTCMAGGRGGIEVIRFIRDDLSNERLRILVREVRGCPPIAQADMVALDIDVPPIEGEVSMTRLREEISASLSRYQGIKI